ncbi:hypothetical protein APR12_004273 [Nocardia amikacinitolerans]|uniref:hypothetical protein n=1 Tax=Nocardia amikacinitolerans TaxID=756689 RepID=UPI000831A0B2|nr:hypothetical protein [Nocardia amikacinitolerans]MCP2318910.1 hypothetical protein [Nocardia amikacinitolerans]
MPEPHREQPNLPTHLTWEELEKLPAEIAAQIELWNGRVVWLPRGPGRTSDIHRPNVDSARTLRPSNYLLTGEWTRDAPNGIEFDFPFPISIPWTELEF